MPPTATSPAGDRAQWRGGVSELLGGLGVDPIDPLVEHLHQRLVAVIDLEALDAVRVSMGLDIAHRVVPADRRVLEYRPHAVLHRIVGLARGLSVGGAKGSHHPVVFRRWAFSDDPEQPWLAIGIGFDE